MSTKPIPRTASQMEQIKATAKEIQDSLYPQRRRSKYNVDQSAKGKEDRTCDNIPFASVHEMEVYRDYIKPQVAAGLFRDLKFQVPFDLHVTNPGGFKVKVGTYKADFTAQDRSGRLLVIEAKGMATPLYKRNRKHVEAEYGLRILEL